VVEDLYIGGSLSFRIRFSGLDGIALLNSSKEEVFIELCDHQVSFYSKDYDEEDSGLPGKRSLLIDTGPTLTLDSYFEFSEDFVLNKLKGKKVRGISFTGTRNFDIENYKRYTEVFNKVINQTDHITVNKGMYPSCSGCPIGCIESKKGEIGGNVLLHSLCACEYSNKIYSDLGIVFSCLNILGYDYTHEDIENLPELVSQTLKKMY
jgi:hypothetical protein